MPDGAANVASFLFAGAGPYIANALPVIPSFDLDVARLWAGVCAGTGFCCFLLIAYRANPKRILTGRGQLHAWHRWSLNAAAFAALVFAVAKAARLYLLLEWEWAATYPGEPSKCTGIYTGETWSSSTGIWETETLVFSPPEWCSLLPKLSMWQSIAGISLGCFIALLLTALVLRARQKQANEMKAYLDDAA